MTPYQTVYEPQYEKQEEKDDSFLTAAPVRYVSGAGKTDVAGTTHALQSIHTKGLIFYSFLLQDMDALYRGDSTLHPCVRIG